MKRLSFIQGLLACWFILSCSISTYAADPRAFLLSNDFFSDFYGTDCVDLIDFNSQNEMLTLNFKTDLEVARASFDAPFNVDCSGFSSYELVVEIDEPTAIGFTSLYFHSKNGWYSFTASGKRALDGGRFVYSFNANNFRKEDSPAGLDKIDAIRISFWRGQNVDAKLTFHSLKAARLSSAIVSIDDNGGENGGIINSFEKILGRCGINAEKVDGSQITRESLERFSTVFLPIAGQIKPETVDALCDYIDAGGFVFAFYNVPDKLLKKLGVKQKGFVRCSTKKIEIVGMAFDPTIIEFCQDRGYCLPEKIAQESWNFYHVELDPLFSTDRQFSLWGDSKVRVVANWELKDKGTSEYPALVIGPNGVYCSHIFMLDDLVARKKFFETIIASVSPQVSKSFIRADWKSIFKIGLEPSSDVSKANHKMLDRLENELTQRGWTLTDAVQFMNDDKKDKVDYSELSRFGRDIVEIKQVIVDLYCSTRKSRENEGRLWWEHSGCGIYPGDWERTMRELADAGFNAVIPNMLWGGNAYYKSAVLPVDSKVEKYGDQIAQAVAAGKKYGIEVHAWMVCFNASNSPQWFIDKMREEGRLQRTVEGEEKPWLCPSHPENRALQLVALEEVATKYEVDGVHFDYIRFPDDKTCYCDGCKERFAQFYFDSTGEDVGEFPRVVLEDGKIRDAFRQWRCDQITALVRDVHCSLKEKRPEIKISAAVFTGYPGTKRSIGQDWGLWVDEGLLDFVCPMDYTNDPASFENFVKQQLPYTEGKVQFYPGIGMTATGISMDAEEVILQAEIAKRCGAQGFTIFNLSKSTADKALPAFKKGTNSKPTTAPHRK